VFCHNPTNTGDDRVSRHEGQTVIAQSVDFKVMIHKIHRGQDLVQEYILGGVPTPSTSNPGGTPVDFGQVRFPGDLRACGTCHVASSFSLPLAATVLPSRAEKLTCIEDPAADGDAYCNLRTSTELFTPPTAAVCTSCHDATSTAAHAEIMTTASGVESCETCHGPGSAYDMARAHRRDP
jgi:OmcA/MtrC family decaheme c-type cytochrome